MTSNLPEGARRSPADIMAVLNRAVAAHQAGNLARAKSLYQLVLADDDKQFDALHMLGVLAGQSGEFLEAERLIRLAIEVDAESFEALCNLARVLVELRQYDEALAAADRALALDPSCVNAQLLRGSALLLLRKPEPALQSFDRALELKPDFAMARFDRGEALFELQRYEQALAAYRGALALVPNYADAWRGVGNVLSTFRHSEQALAAYDRALAINPQLAQAWLGRGNVLCYPLERFGEARGAYDKALALEPGLKYAPGARLLAQLYLCDWRDLDAECARLIAAVEAGEHACDPFTMLAIPSSPLDQFACARLFAGDRLAPQPPLTSARRQSHDRLRIAYLSADFRQHVIASVVAELIELHDRNRFEVLGVSWGRDDGSELRARLVAAFDRFHDVGANSDLEIAHLLHEAEVDVVVDLMGYTALSRPGILAHRPAPVQVGYLGFPGTMATDFIDYILADHLALPFDQQAFFTEKIVHLPDSYQPTDSKRAVSAKIPRRSEIGLPDDGFVFCCFNSSYKISPTMFDVWMRLLRSVERSVLWLTVPDDATRGNLWREAERRNVAVNRLVLTERVGHTDYLRRQSLADLFLDTLPYNAHGTASNALAAGLPVLTCRGETFAGRVGASLLHAVGLPELVTTSREEYEGLALELAKNPERLGSIRRKLEANRASCPLFDAARLCRHVEMAYEIMWARHRRGEPPGSFTVPPMPKRAG